MAPSYAKKDPKRGASPYGPLCLHSHLHSITSNRWKLSSLWGEIEHFGKGGSFPCAPSPPRSLDETLTAKSLEFNLNECL